MPCWIQKQSSVHYTFVPFACEHNRKKTYFNLNKCWLSHRTLVCQISYSLQKNNYHLRGLHHAIPNHYRNTTMTVASVMTKTPACCTPKSSLTEVARMMVDNNCGQIPVVEDFTSHKLTGVITDRDIATRIVAKGHNSAEVKVCDCMTSPCVSVTGNTSLTSCCELMETNKIRRLPVVDDKGSLVGIVSLADVVLNTSIETSASVLKEVSTGD